MMFDGIVLLMDMTKRHSMGLVQLWMPQLQNSLVLDQGRVVVLCTKSDLHKRHAFTLRQAEEATMDLTACVHAVNLQDKWELQDVCDMVLERAGSVWFGSVPTAASLWEDPYSSSPFLSPLLVSCLDQRNVPTTAIFTATDHLRQQKGEEDEVSSGSSSRGHEPQSTERP